MPDNPNSRRLLDSLANRATAAGNGVNLNMPDNAGAFQVIRDLAAEVSAQRLAVDTLTADVAKALQHSAQAISAIAKTLNDVAGTLQSLQSDLKASTAGQSSVLENHEKTMRTLVQKMPTAKKQGAFLQLVYDSEGEMLGIEVKPN